MEQQKLWIEVETSKRRIVLSSHYGSDFVHDWCCYPDQLYPELACAEIRELLQLDVYECLHRIRYF